MIVRREDETDGDDTDVVVASNRETPRWSSSSAAAFFTTRSDDDAPSAAATMASYLGRESTARRAVFGPCREGQRVTQVVAVTCLRLFVLIRIFLIAYLTAAFESIAFGKEVELATFYSGELVCQEAQHLTALRRFRKSAHTPRNRC